MELAIFGAQGYALGAYEALRALYPRRIVPFFIVSKIGNNAPKLGGVPVKEIAAVSSEMSKEDKQNLEVVIATPENVQPEIEETLENYGFRHYSRLDSERWGELMKMFHIKLDRFLPLSALPVGYNKPFTRIYMAKSHKDRPLKNMVSLPDYIFPLQVGMAYADIKIADLADDKGENISEKNCNYSELSGLYWIWKNKLCSEGTPEGVEGQYCGLAQYRRMLVFSEDDLLRLQDNDVDVVLPYPMPYEPNIHAHHERYLKDADWTALLTALRELQPEYAEYFPQVLEQRYLYNYNVILAKKAVLRDYCAWLFPILERTEELSDPKGSERADRYIGYMGETLETLYFMKNAAELNIVHTGCKLYT
ncbi:MAG: DUF4422 domain-containing protein [Lachnospiraceae bacterium]|nr:DUF4422 domain-containing protein [Lachnospiraceae bacterium]